MTNRASEEDLTVPPRKMPKRAAKKHRQRLQHALIRLTLTGGTFRLDFLLRLVRCASSLAAALDGPGRRASPILTPASGLGRYSIGASITGSSMLPATPAGA
eukprot:16444390-Heterocapsa_arctica.AAC.1